MMSNQSLFAVIAITALSWSVHAAEPANGLAFQHEDWEIACDNTRTCRAAGYQNDADERAVSVLLTRKAGPGEPIAGELMLGQADDESEAGKLPPVLDLSMRINGQDLGQVAVGADTSVAKLSEMQVAALLAALPRKSDIEWKAGENRWRLSDKGAAAVLLKMDEFQGRLGTQGALVRKGPKGEKGVLPALPVPVVVAGPLAKPLPGDERLAADKAKALRKAILATVTEDDCPMLLEDEGDKTLQVTRLSDSKLLVSTRCWMGAYNVGTGYWVMEDKPPYRPVLVTASGSDYGKGEISASHKGRGLGDCWSSDAWTWDGARFVHTESSSTGLCKMVAAGGAWSLPTIVTEVRR